MDYLRAPQITYDAGVRIHFAKIYDYCYVRLWKTRSIQRGVEVSDQLCQTPARNVGRKEQRYNRKELYPCLLTAIHTVVASIHARDINSRTSTVNTRHILDNRKSKYEQGLNNYENNRSRASACLLHRSRTVDWRTFLSNYGVARYLRIYQKDWMRSSQMGDHKSISNALKPALRHHKVEP